MSSPLVVLDPGNGGGGPGGGRGDDPNLVLGAEGVLSGRQRLLLKEHLVTLTRPDGLTVDATARLMNDLGIIAEATEVELLELTHQDIDLVLDDRDGFFAKYFEDIVPGELWEVSIERETGRRRPLYDKVFGGILDVPWSISRDLKNRTMSLRAFSYSKRLEHASAEVIKRTFGALTGTVTADTKVVTVSDTTDMANEDEITIDDGVSRETQRIYTVDSGSQVTTYENWTNEFSGDTLTVETPYYRNKTVAWLAAALFAQAGITSCTIKTVSPLASFPVAMPMNTDGLPDVVAPGDLRGLFVRDGKLIAQIGVTEYEATSPTSGFTTGGSYTYPSHDWSRQYLDEPANEVVNSDTEINPWEMANFENDESYWYGVRGNPTLDCSVAAGSAVVTVTSGNTNHLRVGDVVWLDGGLFDEERTILTVDTTTQFTTTATYTYNHANRPVVTYMNTLYKRRDGVEANNGDPYADSYEVGSDDKLSYTELTTELVVVDGYAPTMVFVLKRPHAVGYQHRADMMRYTDASMDAGLDDTGTGTHWIAADGVGYLGAVAVPGHDKWHALWHVHDPTYGWIIFGGQVRPNHRQQAFPDGNTYLSVPDKLVLRTLRRLGDYFVCLYETTTSVRMKCWDLAFNEVYDLKLTDEQSFNRNWHAATVWPLANGDRVGVYHVAGNGAGSPGKWYVVSQNNYSVVPYADFDGMSVGTALKELALLSMSYVTVDRYGDGHLRSRAFLEDDASSAIEVPVPRSLERKPLWEFYRSSVSIKGKTENDVEFELILGDSANSANRLKIESDLLTTETYAYAVGLSYVSFLSQLIGEERAVIDDAAFDELLHALDLVMFDGALHRITEVETDLGSREISLVMFPVV